MLMYNYCTQHVHFHTLLCTYSCTSVGLWYETTHSQTVTSFLSLVMCRSGAKALRTFLDCDSASPFLVLKHFRNHACTIKFQSNSDSSCIVVNDFCLDSWLCLTLSRNPLHDYCPSYADKSLMYIRA